MYMYSSGQNPAERAQLQSCSDLAPISLTRHVGGKATLDSTGEPLPNAAGQGNVGLSRNATAAGLAPPQKRTFDRLRPVYFESWATSLP